MVSRMLKTMVGEIGPMLWAVARDLVAMFRSRGTSDQVVVMARAIVARIAGQTTLDGDKKWDAAKAALLADIKSAGIVVADRAINFILEGAYNELAAARGWK